MPGGAVMARQIELRVFSLPEANRSITELRKTLPVLRRTLRDIEKMEDRLDVLDLICNRSVASDNPDLQEYLNLKVDYHRKIKEFEGLLLHFEKEGYLLRDLDKGVVHFVGRKDGETVLLCWKEGEKKITHWHSLENGGSTVEDDRRRIDDIDEFSEK
jgi:hypothetical protein